MLYLVHASFTHGVYTYGKVPKRFKSEKYEFVTWDDYSHILWKNKKCSKPPSLFHLYWSRRQGFMLTTRFQVFSRMKKARQV
jgi:hypothetical protein